VRIFVVKDVVQDDRVISAGQGGKTWLCADYPVLDYREAWDLQLGLVAARKAGRVPDIFLLVEHAAVFTLGRRGGRENLTVPEGFLEERGIPLLHVERGGDITFHGPGQLVGYPIIDLHAAALGVTEYVEYLEEVMILTAAHCGVSAGRNRLNRGIWVGNSKLGSIGIAIRRGIAFHGFAFNVNLSLEPFTWINPCGLQGIGVTSLERELSRKLPMIEVREQLKHNIEVVFGVDLVSTDTANLQPVLQE
jgi:lipoate-protein ligase B